MKFKIICILICLIIAISFPAIADTIANDNTKLFESEYTVMIGLISGYSEDGDDVNFHADFLFFYFFSLWVESDAGFVIDKGIYLNTSHVDHDYFKTRSGPNGLSFYYGVYGTQITIID